MDIKPIIIKEKHKGGIVNSSSLLKNGVRRLGCIGSSGSGKTTFITRWFIPMIHPVFKILVIAKNQDQDQYKAIEKYCKQKNIEYLMLDEFTMKDFQDLRCDDTPKLIIYDDLANTDNIDALLAVSKYGRVSHCYLCVISQDYKSINLQVRQNLNMYVIFPLGAAHAARSMINGLSAYVNGENLKKAYKYICKPQNRFSCLIIQTDGPSVIMLQDGELYDIQNNFKQVTLKKHNQKKNKSSDSESDDEKNI